MGEKDRIYAFGLALGQRMDRGWETLGFPERTLAPSSLPQDLQSISHSAVAFKARTCQSFHTHSSLSLWAGY